MATPGASADDLARRVGERRVELGLSVDEVAERAGMARGYLEYLEDAAANVSMGSLLRLAAALETTADALAGVGIGAPAGRHARAGRSPYLEALDHDECFRRLAAGGVGRIVFVDEYGPVALPVSFALLDGDVVFRTDEHGSIARTLGSAPGTVSFEVDHIDDALREGWSVLIHGQATRIEDERELTRAQGLAIEPWSGRELNLYLRITPTGVTGRRIRVRH
jgi:transcriptional regulator with XRE-family HTH domain